MTEPSLWRHAGFRRLFVSSACFALGVWVDRVDRARWARLAMAGMMAFMAAQASLLARGDRLLGPFFVAAFALMTLNYVYGICRMGLVKEMLPSALLLPATGQLSTITQDRCSSWACRWHSSHRDSWPRNSPWRRCWACARRCI